MIVHEGHKYTVSSVAFSPDGKSLASGSWDETIRMWDADSASAIGEPLRGHSGWINSISYSPLGNVIASGSRDNTIRLWDVNTRRQLGEPIKGDNPIRSVAFSPDAKLIVSGGGDRYTGPSAHTVKLWGVHSRSLASGPFKGHTTTVNSVQFSPDGAHVVSGSGDNTIRVWDVKRGTTIVGPLEGHTSSVRSTSFSPDGSQIVSCSNDGTVRLWDVRTGRMIGNPYGGHTGGVNSVSFSPRGTYVVSGGGDKTVRLWDIKTGRQVDQPYEEHTDTVFSVAFSPCGQYVASGSYDRKVIIRSTSCDYSGTANTPGSRMITSQMSIWQMFDCLTANGCVDLSSQMDSQQEAAVIVSGGGFGDIWTGSLHNGGKVAIKAWRANKLEQCSYKTLKRAARELYYWSRMQHPNIHRLQGVIMFKDQYLGMVSEWMENGNLHEYLRKYPDTDRYQLCVHVASGLEYMYSRNTIHGDLKAANVLVSSDGTAKLSDFDFSIMSEASTLVFSETSNSRSGSLRWVAPEMLLSEASKRTTQSDIYALGMTMLEILTGKVPYSECRQDYTIIKKVEKGTLPNRPLDLLKDDTKGNTMWLLLSHCWRRDSSNRPSAERVLGVLVHHVCKA